MPDALNMEATASMDAGETLPAADEHLARVLAARLIGDHNARGYSDVICRLLAAIEDLGGSWPSPAQTEERLGIDIDALWLTARRRHGLLDEALITEFYPRRIWQALVDVATSSPVEFQEQATEVLKCWAAGVDLDGEALNAKLAPATLKNYIRASRKLMNELCELRKLVIADFKKDAKPKLTWNLGLAQDALEAWHAEGLPRKVTVKDLSATLRELDRRAPRLILIRRVLRGHTKRIEKQRRSRARSRRAHVGLFLAYRNRAIIALAALGLRKSTIRFLTRSDVIWKHDFGDGVIGPALRLRRLKYLPGVVRFAAIPPLVADWIQEYVDYMETLGFVLPEDDPLWQPNNRDRWGTRATAHLNLVDRAVAHTIARYAAKGERRYSPHTLRHLAEKLSFLAGMDWLVENREELILSDGHGLPDSPQTFSDVQLDHTLHELKDRYKDINTEVGRMHWRRLAALGMWEYLWGDKGARKAPDVDRIRHARKSVNEAEARVDRAGRHMNRIARQKQKVIQAELNRVRAVQATVSTAGGSPESIHDLMVAMLDSQAAVMHVAELADQLAIAVSEHEQAANALERARDELIQADSSRVAVADDVPDDEIPTIESIAVPRTITSPSGEQSKLRDWVDPVEYRWAIGENVLSASTLRRWIATGRTRVPAGHPDRLFDHNPDGTLKGVLHVRGRHDTRITVHALPLENYHPHVIARLNWLLTQPWPAIVGGTSSTRHGGTRTPSPTDAPSAGSAPTES